MPTHFSARCLAIAVAVLLSSSALAHAQTASGVSPDFPQANSAFLDIAPASAPEAGRQADQDVERAVRRFGIGVDAGVALDPELVMIGAHGTFGPIFRRGVEFRPGVEVGIGEITTLLGINLDVLYMLPGATRQSRWMAYVGAGPTFGLSHRGFETKEDDHVTINGRTATGTVVVGSTDGDNRFDFSDTDFNGGVNFLAGARNQRGLSFELKATAWGVSNIRMLVGFNF
jgi:hypothetical protein